MEDLKDAAGTAHRRFEGEPRIVSLVPSLTELLCDLGLAEQLVGRTGFCIHPGEKVRSVPKVGGTKDINIARIRAARPTHVVVNVDENRREDVEVLSGFVPHIVVTHPNTPSDNITLYRLLGGIFGRHEEAERLEEGFREAMHRLAEAVRDLPRERVLYLIWKKPWMTVSRDTYVSAMLRAAGWDTVPAVSDVRYPEVDLPLAGEVPPDFLFLSSEPYHFREKHIPEAESAFGVKARLIDGEMVSWYGSRAIMGLNYLALLRQR